MSVLRLSTANAFLLACYFIASWGIAAVKIVMSPIRGLYDPANIASTIFVSDHLQLFAAGTTRFAWLLALAKLLVAAFFGVFALLFLSTRKRRSGEGDEALVIALVLGGMISFASMVFAAQVGELAALRLHATESLILIGGLLLVIVDAPQAQRQSEPDIEAPLPAALPGR